MQHHQMFLDCHHIFNACLISETVLFLLSVKVLIKRLHSGHILHKLLPLDFDLLATCSSLYCSIDCVFCHIGKSFVVGKPQSWIISTMGPPSFAATVSSLLFCEYCTSFCILFCLSMFIFAHLRSAINPPS